MPTAKYPCRCLTRINGIKCTQRRSLARHPKNYLRPPKCPQCGQSHWYIESYRMRKEMGSKPMCMCSGYHFPHRKGSKYCQHNPDFEKNWTERLGEVVVDATKPT